VFRRQGRNGAAEIDRLDLANALGLAVFASPGVVSRPTGERLTGVARTA
jgi:hypothetical protein